ncbi:winged helix-turn-helix domain-containing protein [uncultured Winogradskyella sp.]|uniref:winged helix-turn-helix domain-containing protein n=1 Tax=Winogradskyella sp. 4-2091 TaxID=3381659 RepID=UPI00260C6B9E|nr:winged helix-turn-helix domain-containing protein [uncultured Winogradskyella sp.]
MKLIKRFFFYKIIVVIGILSLICCSSDQNTELNEITKIAIRDIGNKVLLENKDSTSLVLPVIPLNSHKYQLSFNDPLSIEPSTLTKIIEESLQKADLSNQYRVEVKDCKTEIVSYSFQVNDEKERTIIPCLGRNLPKACYIIQLQFIDVENTTKFSYSNSGIILILGLVLVCILYFGVKKYISNDKHNNETSEKLGIFYFYPEQNKLVKEREEIALSKKECELLALLVANPNQIIKRDELTKRVWEDNGVFVGRSLDTYISKLRKKLKADSTIRITNIHGVGYKLETDI